MTLLDLLKLIKHYFVLFIVITLACALAGAGFAVLKSSDDSYSATATIIVSDQVGGIGALAAAQASEWSSDTGVALAATSDEKTNSITITAEGSSGDDCVAAANEVAEQTEKLAHELYDKNISVSGKTSVTVRDQDSAVTVYQNTINVQVVKATHAQIASGGKSLVKFGAVGLAGGLVLALCVIVVIDIVRRPIRNATEVAEALEVPLVATSGMRVSPDMLYANVALAAGEEAKSVCIAAVGDGSASDQVIKSLSQSMPKDSVLSFKDGGSLTKSAQAVECAAQSDVVVLCMQEWDDTLNQLECAVNELSLAKTKLVGIAVLPAGKAK